MLEAYATYLKEKYKSKHTIGSYWGNVARYLRWCEDTYGSQPAELFRSNVTEFKSYMMTVKKCKPETVNSYICALIAYNKFLIEQKLQADMVVFPADEVKIQPKAYVDTAITEAEVNQIRQKVLEYKGKYSKRDFAIITLFSYAAPRREELSEIFLADVHLDTSELLIRDGKGGKARTLLINDRIVSAIRSYLAVRVSDSPYLFVSRQNEKLSLSRINQIIDKFARETESEVKVTPHKFRKFFAKRGREAGMEINEIQDHLGHKNAKTTFGYFEVTKKEMLDKVNKL